MSASFSFSKSVIFSENPTMYIATATALAKAKISPMAPPNFGPKDREIRKYAPPPRTLPFVHIAYLSFRNIFKSFEFNNFEMNHSD